MVAAALALLMFLSPQTGPAPAWVRADAARMAEALDLDDSQRVTLLVLLADHEAAWMEARTRVEARVRRAGPWQEAEAAQAAWREASALSKQATRAHDELARRSLSGGVPTAELAQSRLRAQEAAQEAGAARLAMVTALHRADPGRSRLLAALAEAHRELSSEFDATFQVLLDDEQTAIWPQVRRMVRRARRLRSLSLAGAQIDLRGEVLRRTGAISPALASTLDAWARETDEGLDRIEAMEVEAAAGADPSVAAVLLAESDLLRAAQIDRTLDAALKLHQLDPVLSGLHGALRARAWPRVRGHDRLDDLVAAARRAGASDLLVLALEARERCRARIEVHAHQWEAIERAARLAQLMRRRNLPKDAVDAADLSAANEALREIGRQRDALVAQELRSLLQSTTRARVREIAPNLQLPEEDSVRDGESIDQR